MKQFYVYLFINCQTIFYFSIITSLIKQYESKNFQIIFDYLIILILTIFVVLTIYFFYLTFTKNK